ncbi:hypothetical protein FB107DRAFT_294296 [Schizophyllum commune]
MTTKKHPATGSEHATSPGRARQMATQNLPHDILSEIFLEVVSRYHILSHNLAINVPYGESWTCTVEDEIRNYLSRSRRLPLHVCASGDMSDPCYNAGQGTYLGVDFCPRDEFALRAIEFIGKLCAYRWKSLSLSGHHDVFDRQEKLALPLLDSITIAVKAPPNVENADPLRLTFLEQAPHVRKMTLDMRYLAFSLPAWDSLKEATFVFLLCDETEFMTVENQIKLRPQLETLEVYDPDGHFGVFAPQALPIGALIHMPHLTSVTVSGIGHLILTCLAAPNLRKVAVAHGYEEDGPGPLSSIMRMPDGSSLRALELVRVQLDRDVEMDIVYRCLEGLPALESMHVENSRRFVVPESILRKDLIVWLTRTGEAPALLPKLAELFLYFGASRPGGAEERLRELLASRASEEQVGDAFLRALTRFDTDISEELCIA